MSENTDRIIDTHLKQRPSARHAYSHDPTMHNDIERARGMLDVMESAMRREGIPFDSAERVLNEIVSAGLDGWEREKVNRERLLLLADMDISTGITPVFTEPGPGAAQLSDGTPEQLAAWVEKKQGRLRRAAGFDLSAQPDTTDEP